MQNAGNEREKEADLLCGDSICNYKTVQSFGHEQQIFDMYQRMLDPIEKEKKRSKVLTALALGIN